MAYCNRRPVIVLYQKKFCYSRGGIINGTIAIEDPLLYYTRRSFAIQEVVLSMAYCNRRPVIVLYQKKFCYSRGGIINGTIAIEDPLLYYTRRSFAIQEVVLASLLKIKKHLPYLGICACRGAL